MHIEPQDSAVTSGHHFRRPVLAIVILLAVALVGIYLRYSPYRPCEADAVKETSAILVSQMRQYDDVYVPATDGARTSIEYPVAVMQRILMDTRQVVVPPCLQTAKNELLDYMGTVLDALEAFRAGEPDAKIQALLDESFTHVRSFRLELEAVNQCAPNCWR